MTERNKRKQLIGVVTSKSGDKSVKVVYFYKIPHSLYGKAAQAGNGPQTPQPPPSLGELLA